MTPINELDTKENDMAKCSAVTFTFNFDEPVILLVSTLYFYLFIGKWDHPEVNVKWWRVLQFIRLSMVTF